MGYEIRRHTKPVLHYADRWLVADSEHPERRPVIIDKSLEEAEDFCARLNSGERFWDSRGTETYEEGLRREYERVEGLVDGLGPRAMRGHFGGAIRQTVEHVSGVNWDVWVARRVNKSRRALDLGPLGVES